MSVVSIARQPARDLGIISLPTGFSLSNLPAWAKDWRVWAGLGVAAVVLFALAGKGVKTAKKQRRKQLMAARLKYAEEVARIQRKT